MASDEAPVPAWVDVPDLLRCREIVTELGHLGISAKALEPVRDWIAAQQEHQNEMHAAHMRHCKITTLAGHGFGWGNCPDFICHHCGSPPDADGDHSCPCPYRDEECPDHQRAGAPSQKRAPEGGPKHAR